MHVREKAGEVKSQSFTAQELPKPLQTCNENGTLSFACLPQPKLNEYFIFFLNQTHAPEKKIIIVLYQVFQGAVLYEFVVKLFSGCHKNASDFSVGYLSYRAPPRVVTGPLKDKFGEKSRNREARGTPLTENTAF